MKYIFQFDESELQENSKQASFEEELQIIKNAFEKGTQGLYQSIDIMNQKEEYYNFQKIHNRAVSSFEKKDYKAALEYCTSAIKIFEVFQQGDKDSCMLQAFEVYYIFAVCIDALNTKPFSTRVENLYYTNLEQAAKFAEKLFFEKVVDGRPDLKSIPNIQIAQQLLNLYERLIEAIKRSTKNRTIEYLTYLKRKEILELFLLTAPFGKAKKTQSIQTNANQSSPERRPAQYTNKKVKTDAAFNNLLFLALSDYNKKQYGSAQNLFRKAIKSYKELNSTDKLHNSAKAFKMYYYAALCNEKEGNASDYKSNLREALKLRAVSKRNITQNPIKGITEVEYQKILEDVNDRLLQLSPPETKQNAENIRNKTAPRSQNSSYRIVSAESLFYMPIISCSTLPIKGTLVKGVIQRGTITSNATVSILFSDGTSRTAIVEYIVMYGHILDYAEENDDVQLLLRDIRCSELENAIAIYY